MPSLYGYTYAPRIKVSDDKLATLMIENSKFHEEWNYQLRPSNQSV